MNKPSSSRLKSGLSPCCACTAHILYDPPDLAHRSLSQRQFRVAIVLSGYSGDGLLHQDFLRVDKNDIGGAPIAGRHVPFLFQLAIGNSIKFDLVVATQRWFAVERSGKEGAFVIGKIQGAIDRITVPVVDV